MDTAEKQNERFSLIMRACGGDLDKLRGDRFKPLRKELIRLATGEKPKANECGIHRTISIVYDYVIGIETNDERDLITDNTHDIDYGYVGTASYFLEQIEEAKSTLRSLTYKD